MASYYIVENNQQVGPFTIDQLMAKGITSNTNVWTVGMSNWVTAGEVPELQAVLNSQAQQSSGWQQQSSNQYNYYEPMPDTHKSKAVWSLILSIFSWMCCSNYCFGIISIIFAVMSLVAANKVEASYRVGDMLGAVNSSNEANKWGNWSLILLIVGWFISVVALIVLWSLGILAEIAESSSSYY
jgi:uncharacterized membrane protein